MFNPSKWANSPLGSDFSCQSYSFLKGLSFFLSGFSPSNAKAQVVLVQSCPEAQEVSWSPMQKPNLSTVFQFSFLSYHQHLNKFSKKPNPTKQKKPIPTPSDPTTYLQAYYYNQERSF